MIDNSNRFCLTLIFLSCWGLPVVRAQSAGSRHSGIGEYCDSTVKITDNYSAVNSIDQLLKPLKGRAVFVDLWATWCEPCLDEFKYSDSLHHWLDRHGIEMLYISMDRDKQDVKWKKTIAEYRLCGRHIRANKALQNELTQLIWGARDVLSIPHYILFDKNGGVLDKNAPEPGEGAKLFKDIERKLGNSDGGREK